MAEYQVIARKWRPQRFADVVGQEHVTRTLKNAIVQDRTAHAYLFVGPRGVGKTTLARIFAKALNCQAPEAGEPCCKCPSCVAIAAENSLDVIEIDAASRNSASDMRELADDVMPMPVSGRYKIYIIDEVHMLSKAAWNALLKTVEEPPGHVKFIFATTEVHQVLPTIISRCQRFDLLPIPTRLIAQRLSLIAKAEKVRIEPAAVNAIARAAGGGMRDAQSLLDQMIAFFASDDAGRAITGEQVLSLFGLTDRADLLRLLEAMLDNRPGEIVGIIHSLSVRGKNLETLFDDLLDAWRDIRIIMVVDHPGDILEEDDETIAEFGKLAAKPAAKRAVAVFLEILSPVGRVLHDALNKQVYLETVLLKAVREAHAVKLEDVLARLNQLRQAGELEFLNQLPAADLPAHAGTDPAKKKETAETAPRATASRPATDVPAESGEAPVKKESASTPDPATPAELFAELKRNAGMLKSAPLLEHGVLETTSGSRLRIGFGDDVSDAGFAELTAERTGYVQLIQKLTGDWTSDVAFVRHAGPELPAEAGPEATEEKKTDASPATAAETEAGPEAEEAELPEPAESREPEIPEPAAAPEAPPLRKKGARRSIVNDRPQAGDEAAKRPAIRAALDLFDGAIRDIHEKI